MRFYSFKSLHNSRYVGRLFVKGNGKPFEILTRLNEMAGYAPEEEIELYEVWGSCFLFIGYNKKSKFLSTYFIYLFFFPFPLLLLSSLI